MKKYIAIIMALIGCTFAASNELCSYVIDNQPNAENTTKGFKIIDVRQDSSDMDSSPSHQLFSTTISNFLNDMKGIVFADSIMMRRYALSLFAASIGICYDTTNTYQKVKDVLWSDDAVIEIFKRVGRLPFHPMRSQHQQADTATDNSQHLLTFFNKRFRFLNCSEDRWSQAFSLVDSIYSSVLEPSVTGNTQTRVNFSDTLTTVWHSNGCGCSQYKELNGNVYAIYPYWLTKKGGDTLDFSVITRIAYYGLSAANDGKLKMPSGLSALSFFDRKRQSEFINVAHKHNVKVDWVIKKSNWGDLSNDSLKMQQFFDTLVTQIETLVNKKNNSLFQRFVARLTLDGRDMGNRGDGVTLWFHLQEDLRFPALSSAFPVLYIEALLFPVFCNPYRHIWNWLLSTNMLRAYCTLLSRHTLLQDRP